MPRKKKTVNEMTDREIIESVFSKRIVSELDEEYGLRADEKDDDTGTTPPEPESS